MKFDDFIHRVEQESGAGTRQEAMDLSRAVLETLGERLDRKVRNGVAAQLPRELKELLLARAETTDRYGVVEFYNRVGARAGLTHEDAVARTGQVLAVLREAIPEGEIRDILGDLPPDYEELFQTELPAH